MVKINVEIKILFGYFEKMLDSIKMSHLNKD